MIITRRQLAEAVEWAREVLPNLSLNSTEKIYADPGVTATCVEIMNIAIMGTLRDDDGWGYGYQLFRRGASMSQQGSSSYNIDSTLRLLGNFNTRAILAKAPKSSDFSSIYNLSKKQIDDICFVIINALEDEDKTKAMQELEIKGAAEWLDYGNFESKFSAGVTAEIYRVASQVQPPNSVKDDWDYLVSLYSLYAFLVDAKANFSWYDAALEGRDDDGSLGARAFFDMLLSNETTFTMYRGLWQEDSDDSATEFITELLIRGLQNSDKSPMTVIRKMIQTKTELFLDWALRSRNAGVSWSLMPEAALRFTTWGLLLTAVVHETDVDWAYTWLIFSYLPKEAEFRLMKGRKLVVDNAALVLKAQLALEMSQWLRKQVIFNVGSETVSVLKPIHNDRVSKFISYGDSEKLDDLELAIKKEALYPMREKYSAKECQHMLEQFVESFRLYIKENSIKSETFAGEYEKSTFWVHDGEQELADLERRLAEV